MQVSAARWSLNWSSGVCCLVMLKQVLLVCCKCGWLLCCRFVVSAKGCRGDQRWSSEDFLKLAHKIAGLWLSEISSEKGYLREFCWLVGNWHWLRWVCDSAWLDSTSATGWRERHKYLSFRHVCLATPCWWSLTVVFI